MFFILFTILMISEILLYVVLIMKIGFLNTIVILLILKLIGAFIVAIRGNKIRKNYKQIWNEDKNTSYTILNYSTFTVGTIFVGIPGIISSILGILLVSPKTNRIFFPLFDTPIFNTVTSFVDNGKTFRSFFNKNFYE